MTWVIFLLIPFFIAIPILIYHFLIFPNIDGVVQDLTWYAYDNQSQHFIYWFGFWSSAIFGGVLGSSLRMNNNANG